MYAKPFAFRLHRKHRLNAFMHALAFERPPPFMQRDRSALQCAGARFAETAAPLKGPRRVRFFLAMRTRVP